MEQVVILKASLVDVLTEKVNNILEEDLIKVIDMQYAATNGTFSVLIRYKEK